MLNASRAQISVKHAFPVLRGSSDKWLSALFTLVLYPDGAVPKREARSTPRLQSVFVLGTSVKRLCGFSCLALATRLGLDQDGWTPASFDPALVGAVYRCMGAWVECLLAGGADYRYHVMLLSSHHLSLSGDGIIITHDNSFFKAATERHATGSLPDSIEHNQKRFGYSDDLKSIFANTAAFLEGK
jgi:hypothetical protein